MTHSFTAPFDVGRYGPCVAALLLPPRLCELGPGKPDVSRRDALASLKPDQLGPQIADAAMARACLAGLWLYHDFLDESHAVSQQIHTTTGSYWHGIMHRREGDYGNAKYWFQRVGTHAVHEPLRAAARELAVNADVQVPEPWDPFWFVDFCQACCRGRSPHAALAQRIQMREWELLFDYCYRQAVGGAI